MGQPLQSESIFKNEHSKLSFHSSPNRTRVVLQLTSNSDQSGFPNDFRSYQSGFYFYFKSANRGLWFYSFSSMTQFHNWASLSLSLSLSLQQVLNHGPITYFDFYEDWTGIIQLGNGFTAKKSQNYKDSPKTLFKEAFCSFLLLNKAARFWKISH